MNYMKKVELVLLFFAIPLQVHVHVQYSTILNSQDGMRIN